MLVEPDRGATAWTVFSGPTSYYQDNYEFFFDAFAILTTGNEIADARITLYNRDVRDFEDFKAASTYILSTGQNVAPTKKLTRATPELSQIQRRLKELYMSIDDLMVRVAEDTNAVAVIPSRKKDS